MNEIDNRFFEEYKRLDKLCGEILSCQNGVSEYITQMECTSQGRYKVPSWDKDYRMLMLLRMARNQIAHDVTGGIISEKADLSWVTNFYERIMSQDDPFAQLRKAEKWEEQVFRKSKQHPVQNKSESISVELPPRLVRKKDRRAGWLVGVILAVLVCIFVMNHFR